MTRGRRDIAVAWLTARLPRRLRESLLVRTLLFGPWVFPLRSWWRLLELQKLGPRRDRGPGLIALGVRRWGGAPVYLRPGTTDWETVHVSLIGRYHLPPADLTEIRTILDLGANVGATVADLADRHPGARVLGVELDAGNCEVARRNVERWSNRATIVHGAAWTEDGEIAYGGNRGEWAYRVVPAMDERTQAEVLDRAPAYSIGTLIDRLSPGATVDYLKMDIEGAEEFLLDDGAAWAPRVRCIKVEVHLPLTLETCAAKLDRLGFRTVSDPSGLPCVTGYQLIGS